MTVNVALLGAGRIGQVHARAIESSADAVLYSVTDPNAQVAANLAEALGCKVLSVEDVIASKQVAAVLIATPTDTHIELIEACARAGKAIFCEKPIGLNLQRVAACLNLVSETQTKLMVGFNRRFDDHFLALKDAIVSGAIGDVEQVQITSRDPAPPPVDYIRHSGGLFRDMMIHDFDMARFLLGEEIVSLYATGSVMVDPAIANAGDVDTAMAVLSTAAGKQCIITNSRRATYGYDQRIEVHGSKGMVSANNPRLTSVELANNQGYARGPLHDFFMTRYREAYLNEINAFVEWIKGDLIDVPQGEDGLRALQLAEAAAASLLSGKAEPV